MAIDVRKHKAPIGTETPRRQAFNDLSLSICDVVPVASATERTQLVADLTAAGVGPTAARPLFVYRADATAASEVEYTRDGATWRTVTTKTTMDAAVAGIVPILTVAQIASAATSITAYPMGLSILPLTGAQASSGGWPGAAQCSVLTVKASAAIASQHVYRDGVTPISAFYRQLVPDPGPHSAWLGASAPYAFQQSGNTDVPTTANPSAPVTVTFAAGRFTQPPRVQLTSSQISWHAAITGSPTASSFQVQMRNILGGTGTNPISVYWLAMQGTSAATDY